MLAVKKRDNMETEYSYSDPNPSGKPSLRYLDVKTEYKERTILINNVPIYEYNNKQIKISRKTRIRLRSLVHEAYESNKDNVEFSN